MTDVPANPKSPEPPLPRVPDYDAPVMPNGILGNYWAGNTFVVPEQEAQSSAHYWAGAPGITTPPGFTPGSYNPGSYNPVLNQSNYGGTPATGGAFGSGAGWLNGTDGQVWNGPGLPPGLLGPTFNNLTDQEIREILGRLQY